jgi:hypothetical protein
MPLPGFVAESSLNKTPYLPAKSKNSTEAGGVVPQLRSGLGLDPFYCMIMCAALPPPLDVICLLGCVGLPPSGPNIRVAF